MPRTKSTGTSSSTTDDVASPSVTSTGDDAASSSEDAAMVPAASSAAAAASSSMTVDQHLALTIQTLDQLTSIFNFPHHLSKAAIDECGPEDVTQCYNWILDNHDVEDGGGPVVPKADCPHLESHVKFRVVDVGGKMRMQFENDNNNGSSNLNIEDLEGNLMTSECQHRSVMRKKGSRKRLRSEDGMGGLKPVGRLKCEEDYENDGNGESADEGEGSGKLASKCPGGENWLCLECGALLCSRYANGHAKMHYEDTKEESAATAMGDGDSNLSSNELEEGKCVAVKDTSVGHCVAVSLADLSVWCYECNAYLQHPSLGKLTNHLEGVKFGNKNGKGNNSGEEDDNVGKDEVGGTGEDMEGVKFDNGDDDGDTNESNENGESGRENDVGTLAKLSFDNEDDNKRESNKNYETAGKHETGLEGENMKEGAGKRKGQPRKLPPEQLGTTVISTQQQQQSSDANPKQSNTNGEKEPESDSSSSSEESDEESAHQASLLASLLRSEHGDALRAYLARHQSFDTSDLGQCVPMHLPKPPSFPAEMADFLKSPLCRSIVVLAGAGMSVASGIPDFRSAGVGLYDTLRPELLTATELERQLIEDDPTLALDKGMFLQNPLPMLETKRSFILGTYEKRWKATLAHRFVELLHSKLGKLTRWYTQNIDGLEAQCTDLPREKVVNVHGSMGAAACEQCGTEVDFGEFCEEVRSKVKDITGEDAGAPAESTPVVCDACGNPTVKPTIVLFRGSMPREFHVRTAADLPECDLLIVMGTSLTVAPANSLVYRVPPTALRMVVNNERVGRRLGIDYGEESIRDVFAHGHSDETCLALAEEMGWLDDLAAIAEELPDSSARLLRERIAQRRQEEK